MDTRQDAAATDSLGHAINTTLPSLERFLRVNPRSTLADADALVDEVLVVGRELTEGA